MPPTIFWNTTATGKPAVMMVATDDRPTANPTGTPMINSKPKLTPKTISSMPAPLPCPG